MSLLVVEKVTHGFGARQILEDASFRLLKGEHIGLIGANGEGKSTFLNIITGKIMPDAGNITWSRHVTVGYLDQHSVLKKGMTIREVLRTAFNHMYELEAEMMQLYADMAEADPDKIDEMMEDAGEIQGAHDAGEMDALYPLVLIGEEGELLLHRVVDPDAVRQDLLPGDGEGAVFVPGDIICGSCKLPGEIGRDSREVLPADRPGIDAGAGLEAVGPAVDAPEEAEGSPDG